jgi:hypothetical protein
MDAPLFMALKWDLEYHVHTNAINLVVGAMLIQNLTKKCDQPITSPSILCILILFLSTLKNMHFSRLRLIMYSQHLQNIINVAYLCGFFIL